MESKMIDEFEAALNAMSAVEFQNFWQEVKAESVDGPSAEAFIASFGNTPASKQLEPGNDARPKK